MPRRKTRILIVDGNNVIRASTHYDRFSGDFSSARRALVADVAAFAQGEYQATIVFDGVGISGRSGEVERHAGIDVIFSGVGREADSFIERLAREAREAGTPVTVVTSDQTTQWTVLGEGVTRMSAAGFIDEIRVTDASWGERTQTSPGKLTLGDRLDAETWGKLHRFARGEGADDSE